MATDLTPIFGGGAVVGLVAASGALFFRSWGVSQKQMDTFINQTNEANTQLRNEVRELRLDNWKWQTRVSILASVLQKHGIDVPEGIFGAIPTL